MPMRDILLISSPSGIGKTTFLRQLSEGSLAPEILSRLPVSRRFWPVLEANHILKG